jgi:nitrogen fixation NifU-like protein
VELELDDAGRIQDCFFNGQGCVISQASASMLLEKMHGKSIDDVKQFSAEDMLELYGARLTPNRQKCCLLSWRVLQSAVHSPVGRDGK